MHRKLVIRWPPLALIGLALLGLALRLYGLNWDQSNNFHPDERQILFHVVALAWPNSFAQFLDQANSPLNPHFFAYGSFPLYLLALLGHIFLRTTPADALVPYTLLGRVVSAIFDGATILLTGCLGFILLRDESADRQQAWYAGLLAAAFVVFTPLQLQLSHFYVVDTILLFFVVLTILACVMLVKSERLLAWSCIAGLAYGLAMATKFSAAPLAVPFCVALLLRWYRRRDIPEVVLTLLSTACVTVLVFVLAQPYALLDLNEFVQQVVEQGDMARGLIDFPYTRQFAGTLPYLYEIQNMLLWGMGVTLGCSAFIGLLWLCWRVWRRTAGLWLILLSWLLVYGAIIDSFYVKYMRYMLPVYPLLALVAAAALLALVHSEWRADARPFQWLAQLTSSLRQMSLERILLILRVALLVIVLGGTMFQGLALLNVYSQPNTRVLASRWMYSHLAPGSVLTYEQWDDPLPVAVDGHTPGEFTQATSVVDNQQVTGLDLYGDDTLAKAQQLAQILPTVNALTMTTDRLDKSIPRLPSRYPLTIHYYQLLFSGQLGFRLVAQFENRPNLLGITLDDSSADESYSVFDHPHVRIFVRDNPYPYTSQQLFQKLMKEVRLPSSSAHLSGGSYALQGSSRNGDPDRVQLYREGLITEPTGRRIRYTF